VLLQAIGRRKIRLLKIDELSFPYLLLPTPYCLLSF
jgi:hypothetical protein